ncbi:MAG: MarR family transcriptional regulator [Xanthomonadales bacterium]|nr:MarR family transcriptional regulator [Xanthomonadales bacterium]
MTSFTNSEAYQVIWHIRRLFRLLAARSDEHISDLGVTSADRAVLEFLYPEHAFTVPELAVRYRVTRQHVQVTVNRLLKRGLVEQRPNPRHLRSKLIRLTSRGRKLFETILGRDQEAVTALFGGLPAGCVETTHNTLRTLLERLEGDPQ